MFRGRASPEKVMAAASPPASLDSPTADAKRREMEPACPTAACSESPRRPLKVRRLSEESSSTRTWAEESRSLDASGASGDITSDTDELVTTSDASDSSVRTKPSRARATAPKFLRSGDGLFAGIFSSVPKGKPGCVKVRARDGDFTYLVNMRFLDIIAARAEAQRSEIAQLRAENQALRAANMAVSSSYIERLASMHNQASAPVNENV